MFFWAYLVAVQRSRTDLIGIGGLYFLQGTAPRTVQFRLLGSLAVEVVVAVVTASIRLYSALAFGFLVPVFGLGLVRAVGGPPRHLRAPSGSLSDGAAGGTGKNARDGGLRRSSSG